MGGMLIRAFAWILEFPVIGAAVVRLLICLNNVHKLVSFAEFEELPVFVPLHHCEEEDVETGVKFIEADSPPPEKVRAAVDRLRSSVDVVETTRLSFRRWTVLDYARAYASGKITPTTVARRFVEFVRESASPELQMSFFINYDADDILNQAKESTLRYHRGEALSVLDGVPVAVKDEIDCLPYPTTGGTRWLHNVRQCERDATCVSRLRACGAMIVGKTNMHELGIGISGINPHYGACRNPHDRRKIAGGSSSGSAAVVAAGLCPVALGVDGGGSVRLPAAICGVVGFKPTFARTPHHGVLPLNHTVGMVGILAGTIEDAMICYAAISGGISSDNPGVPLPKIGLPNLNSSNRPIKMARYGKWFNDCSDDIRTACDKAVLKLTQNYGWEIVDVTIPDIEAMRLAHYVTIGSEANCSVAKYFKTISRGELGWDARVVFAAYNGFHSRDYLNAQKMRSRQLQLHRKILNGADVIVTPTVGVTAYTIHDDGLKTGELDYINGAALVRYLIAGNFLGLPAVTVPVGYDRSGLPIGLQFISKPWSESLLIRVASAVQALGLGEGKRPEVFYDMLAAPN